MLRMSWLENPKLQVHPWQIEDYRSWEMNKLFNQLKKLGIALTEDSFRAYAESSENPEELIDFLWIDEEDVEGYHHAYLLLFEIWRRLMVEKPSLSVFCDELDRLIEAYDRGQPDEELLDDALADLEDILDQMADQQGSPKKVFQEVSLHCAQDLEGFLYDYISDQITAGNELYASELLDGNYEFLSDRKRFDFLRGPDLCEQRS